MNLTQEELLKLPLDVRAEMALREAVAEVIAEHKRLGLPLAMWRDGKAVWIYAEELEAERLGQSRPATAATDAHGQTGSSAPVK
jgi:hypothetical protein